MEAFSRLVYLLLVSLSLIILYETNSVDGAGALELEAYNFDSIIASTELVFLNYYVEWCPFSTMLAPIFNEAADKVNNEFPSRAKVVLGRVNCDTQTDVCTKHAVMKYPTLKLIRDGEESRKEYRGARTPVAFLEYIRKEMQNPLKEFRSVLELNKLDDTKRHFVGYLNGSVGSPVYETFKKVATRLKDDCTFHVGFEEVLKGQVHLPGHDVIAFHPDRARSLDTDETFKGNPANHDELFKWVDDRCLPLIREITFENAEELTEEQLPLLILFHHPNDTQSVKSFNRIAEAELLHERHAINFLTADGLKFSHPLQHLEKSNEDLPILALDSFQHLFLFPDIKRMEVPGVLKQFLDDYHSEKLHDQFHENNGQEGVAAPTLTVTESVFIQLAPSKQRYTYVKDEL